jgi:hypothetical protein
MYLDRVNGVYKQMLLSGVSTRNYFLSKYFSDVKVTLAQAILTGAILTFWPWYNLGYVIVPLVMNALAQPLFAYLLFSMFKDYSESGINFVMNFGTGILSFLSPLILLTPASRGNVRATFLIELILGMNPLIAPPMIIVKSVYRGKIAIWNPKSKPNDIGLTSINSTLSFLITPTLCILIYPWIIYWYETSD